MMGSSCPNVSELDVLAHPVGLWPSRRRPPASRTVAFSLALSTLLEGNPMTHDLLTLLRSAGIGRVLGAGDPSAAGALAGFDTSIGYRPDAIVTANTPLDVEHAIAVAAAEGVPLVALGMGHGMPSSIDGGIVVTTSGLAGSSIDPDARTATIAAGTAWSSVVAAASPHGLAPICGSAPSVGAVGYLLGGGIGPLVRTVGVSSDLVRSVELVTPPRPSLT